MIRLAVALALAACGDNVTAPMTKLTAEQEIATHVCDRSSRCTNGATPIAACVANLTASVCRAFDCSATIASVEALDRCLDDIDAETCSDPGFPESCYYVLRSDGGAL